MVQFKILSGQMAGTTWVARRFPVQIGRSAEADLRVEEPGVWDRHLVVKFEPAQGFVLESCAEAVAHINGEAQHQAVLRNGDEIAIGALKMRFWLTETTQRDLRLRERLIWGLLVAVTLGQVFLVYWLMQ